MHQKSKALQNPMTDETVSEMTDDGVIAFFGGYLEGSVTGDEKKRDVLSEAVTSFFETYPNVERKRKDIRAIANTIFCKLFPNYGLSRTAVLNAYQKQWDENAQAMKAWHDQLEAKK